MFDSGQIDQGVRMMRSRYLLCAVIANRAKSLFRRRRSGNLASCAQRALSEIIHNQIAVIIPERFAAQLFGDRSSFRQDMEPDEDLGLTSLFALGRAELEEGGWGYVGRTYSVQIGISASTQPEFDAYPFDIRIEGASHLPFDFLIHLSGNLTLKGEWHKSLDYDPTSSEPQFVDFEFKITRRGDSIVKVDCYHEQRWLRTMLFEFEAMQMSMRAAS
jgi:hypothetical protein